MKIFKSLTVIILFFTILSSFGQTIKIDTVYANNGDTVYVPLSFYGYNNVGAITLYIIYDETVLEYLGFANLASQGQGILTNAFLMGDHWVVGIAWTAPGSSGVNFPDGKLMDLKFVFNAGFSNLIFNEQFCEVLDWEVEPINGTYVNGLVDHLTGVEQTPDPLSYMYVCSNKLYINNPSSRSVEIYNTMGQLVFYKSLSGNQGLQELTLSGIKPGIYILQSNEGNTKKQKKIFIGTNN